MRYERGKTDIEKVLIDKDKNLKACIGPTKVVPQEKRGAHHRLGIRAETAPMFLEVANQQDKKLVLAPRISHDHICYVGTPDTHEANHVWDRLF